MVQLLQARDRNKHLYLDIDPGFRASKARWWVRVVAEIWVWRCKKKGIWVPSARWIWASRLLPPVPPGTTTSPSRARLLSSSLSSGVSIATASRTFSLSTILCSSTISLSFSAGSRLEASISWIFALLGSAMIVRGLRLQLNKLAGNVGTLLSPLH